MLRNYKIRWILFIVLIGICHSSLLNAQTQARSGSAIPQFDMWLVMKNSLLGALYGATVVGGINTVIILMEDDTKTNLYRIKYGFAVGTILGILYGSIMGFMDLPLIPGAGGGSPENPPPKASMLQKNLYATICSINIQTSNNELFFYTQLLNFNF